MITSSGASNSNNANEMKMASPRLTAPGTRPIWRVMGNEGMAAEFLRAALRRFDIEHVEQTHNDDPLLAQGCDFRGVINAYGISVAA